MTKQNPGLHGQNGSQPRWEITTIRRISIDPAAWRGTTADGFLVHLSYRCGTLRIEFAEPSAQHPGSYGWRELLVIRPDYIELELDLLRHRRNPLSVETESIATRRREQRLIADWLALGECRSDRRKQALRMTFWRLRSVLNAREENLAYLHRIGVAGAPVHLTLAALLEG